MLARGTEGLEVDVIVDPERCREQRVNVVVDGGEHCVLFCDLCFSRCDVGLFGLLLETLALGLVRTGELRCRAFRSSFGSVRGANGCCVLPYRSALRALPLLRGNTGLALKLSEEAPSTCHSGSPFRPLVHQGFDTEAPRA